MLFEVFRRAPRTILSYQPNEIDSNKFILTRNKILPFINNKKSLKKNLLNILIKENSLSYNHNIQFNSIDKIISFVDRELYK